MMDELIEFIDHLNMAKSYLEALDYLFARMSEENYQLPDLEGITDDMKNQILEYRGRIFISEVLIFDTIKGIRKNLIEAKNVYSKINPTFTKVTD